MAKYKITLKAETTYEVEAENLTEEKAVDIAFDWWEDYIPEVKVEKVD